MKRRAKDGGQRNEEGNARRNKRREDIGTEVKAEENKPAPVPS